MTKSNFPPPLIKVKTNHQQLPLHPLDSWLPDSEITNLEINPAKELIGKQQTAEDILPLVAASDYDATWLLRCLFSSWDTLSEEEQQKYQSRLYRAPGRSHSYQPTQITDKRLKRIRIKEEKHFSGWVLLRQGAEVMPPIMLGRWPHKSGQIIDMQDPDLTHGCWPKALQACQLKDVQFHFAVAGID